MPKKAKVADIIHFATLYGAPFAPRTCVACGKETKLDPCVHCGWPADAKLIDREETSDGV